MRPLALSLLAISLLSATGVPNEFPYSQNVVQHVTFDPQGIWVISGIAGVSEAGSLSRWRRHHLLGSEIAIHGSQVKFSTIKFIPSKQAFSTPVPSQETYDTQSKEFWLDFATYPKNLNLPRYVTAVDLEVGTLLATQDGRTLLDFEGVWFTLEKVGGGNARTP